MNMKRSSEYGLGCAADRKLLLIKSFIFLAGRRAVLL